MNNDTIDTEPVETVQKQKKQKIKLHTLYKKQYTAKSLQKKVLKKIFVPADKEFVSSFFSEDNLEDGVSNKRNAVTFHPEYIQTPKQMQRLNLIAKEIKKQKGHIRIGNVAIVFALVGAVLVFAYFLRNVIARKIIVSGSEKIFNARCEVEKVDFNIFETHLYIKGYRVANKNAPMKNLFEVGLVDIHFNLTELTRRKLVCENIAIEGITWNTPRKTSGALPAKNEPPKKENPVMKLFKKELEKVTSQVSVDRGFAAVKNKLDPKQILDREMAKLETPKITKEITRTVPEFTESWTKRADDVKKQTENTVSAAEKLMKLDVAGIDSLPKLQQALTTVNSAIDTGKQSVHLVENLVSAVDTDVKKVDTLTRAAVHAVTADTAYITKIANDIKAFNFDSGSRLVSGLFDTFIINSLGTMYPYFSTLLQKLQATQKKTDDKPLTLKDKVKKLDRLKGKTFIFEKNPLPSVVFRSISLSGHDPERVLSLGGGIKNVTNNADQLGLPISLAVNAAHGTMKESVTGIIDLRSYSDELVNTDVIVEGIPLNLPSSGVGVPALSGNIKTGGSVTVQKNNDFGITGTITVRDAQLSVAFFEPKIVHTIYSNVIKEIKTISLDVHIHVTDAENFDMKVTTDVDEQIAKGLEKELNRQIQQIKNKIIDKGTAYLQDLKKQYETEIAQFDTIVSDIRGYAEKVQNVDSVLAQNQQELERRIADYGKDGAEKVFKRFF